MGSRPNNGKIEYSLTVALLFGGQGAAIMDRLAFFESVVTKFRGFVYRCAVSDGFRMMEMTPGVELLTGYPASDFIGNAVRSFTSITHPDDVDRVDREVAAAVDQQRHWAVDYRLVRTDGSSVEIHESGSAVYENGKALYLEGVIVDSTEAARQRLRAEDWRSGLQAIMDHTNGITRVLNSLKMLALNARIESARAGAAGASFSVVADEMKKMAADATEIVNRIEAEKDRIFKSRAA
jgi:PAS domain S-box-containing protein